MSLSSVTLFGMSNGNYPSEHLVRFGFDISAFEPEDTDSVDVFFTLTPSCVHFAPFRASVSFKLLAGGNVVKEENC